MLGHKNMLFNKVIFFLKFILITINKEMINITIRETTHHPTGGTGPVPVSHLVAVPTVGILWSQERHQD